MADSKRPDGPAGIRHAAGAQAGGDGPSADGRRGTAHSGEQPAKATLWSRRDWMRRSGWGLLLAAMGAWVVGSFRLLFPRVHHRPASTIRIGRPEDFAVGEVNDAWVKSHRVVVVREPEGFYALRAVCTHLGCIPRWRGSDAKFKCFCHGSGFKKSGINFEGPAPRPLERLEIFLDERGQLVVDTAARLRQERGEWSHQRAFVPFGEGEAHEPT